MELVIVTWLGFIVERGDWWALARAAVLLGLVLGYYAASLRFEATTRGPDTEAVKRHLDATKGLRDTVAQMRQDLARLQRERQTGRPPKVRAHPSLVPGKDRNGDGSDGGGRHS